jgi:hypothetical protein
VTVVQTHAYSAESGVNVRARGGRESQVRTYVVNGGQYAEASLRGRVSVNFVESLSCLFSWTASELQLFANMMTVDTF